MDEKDYENLINSIQDTISAHKKIGENINGMNDKLNTYSKLDNLTDKRRKVFDFLKLKYNDNTDTRKKYFEQMYNNKKIINSQENKINQLKQKINENKHTNDTTNRNISLEKYEKKKYDYYRTMYRVLIIIQLLAIIIIIGNISGILPRNFTFISIGTLSLGVIVYLLYYIYFNNYNRDKHDWDKIYFSDVNESKSECVVPPTQEEKDREEIKKLADEKIKEIIKSQST